MSKLKDIDEIDELDAEIEEYNDNEWDDVKWKKRMDKVSNASQKMGQLLLKGWTMLAEHCEVCSTPLMSLRGGKPICPICNDPDKPKQQNQSNQSNQSNQQSNQSNKPIFKSTIVEIRKPSSKPKNLENSYDKEEKKESLYNIKDDNNNNDTPPPLSGMC